MACTRRTRLLKVTVRRGRLWDAPFAANWGALLMQTVSQILSSLRADRLVVLCIGNPLRGDDGFGPRVAELVQGRAGVRVFDGGAAPENELGRIAALEPEVVLLVDVVDFGGRPGELRVLEPQQMREDDVSTHAASLSVLGEFLREACNARCLVLAAQPVRMALDTPMSPELNQAARQAADEIAGAFPDRP